VQLNPEERQVLNRYWLSADVKIYRHFHKIFEDKVKAFGQSKMDDEEVRMLRLVNQELEDRCVLKQMNLSDPTVRNYIKSNPVRSKTLRWFLNVPKNSIYSLVILIYFL